MAILNSLLPYLLTALFSIVATVAAQYFINRIRGHFDCGLTYRTPYRDGQVFRLQLDFQNIMDVEVVVIDARFEICHPVYDKVDFGSPWTIGISERGKYQYQKRQAKIPARSVERLEISYSLNDHDRDEIWENETPGSLFGSMTAAKCTVFVPYRGRLKSKTIDVPSKNLNTIEDYPRLV